MALLARLIQRRDSLNPKKARRIIEQMMSLRKCDVAKLCRSKYSRKRQIEQCIKSSTIFGECVDPQVKGIRRIFRDVCSR